MHQEAKSRQNISDHRPTMASGAPSLLRQALDGLKGQGYEALIALPETHVMRLRDERSADSDVEMRALCSVDRLDDGRVRVVMQSCAVGFCCVSGVEVEAFLMDEHGQVTAVPEAMMGEFRME